MTDLEAVRIGRAHMSVALFTAVLLAGIAVAATSLYSQNTFDGYTFVFSGKRAMLYDMDEEVVHQWNCPYTIASWADLLRDSSIIVPSKDKGPWEENLPLEGGRLQIINWKGEVTWDYTYRSADYMPHHDCEPVYRTNDPGEKPTFLIICYTKWGDKITELRPTGKNTAEVVWEWVASDHTCEGGCANNSELLDKTKGGVDSDNSPSDIMHTNNISYNRTLDQLVLNLKGYNEFIVIDHSTTTAEARGTTGGKSGKGGNILYRWGNPVNYGVSGAKYFNGQHGGCWVQDTMIGTDLPIPGAGNFLAVDNGGRSVMEIACPGAKDGTYPRNTGKAFEPAKYLWSYSVISLSENEGSIQKLPNGNYLICSGGVSGDGDLGGGTSKVYEVSPSKTVLWDLSGFGISTEGCRYAYSYLGGGTPVAPATAATKQVRSTIKITPNPVVEKVRITMDNPGHEMRLSLFSLAGQELMRSIAPMNSNGWDIGNTLPEGMYLVKIVSDNSVYWNRVSLFH